MEEKLDKKLNITAQMKDFIRETLIDMFIEGYSNSIKDKSIIHDDFLDKIKSQDYSFIDQIYFKDKLIKSEDKRHKDYPLKGYTKIKKVNIDVAILFKKLGLSNGEIEEFLERRKSELKKMIKYNYLYLSAHIYKYYNAKNITEAKKSKKNISAFPLEERLSLLAEEFPIDIKIEFVTKSNKKIKFQKLSERRLEKIEDAFTKLQRLSEKANYSYDIQDWHKIKNEILIRFYDLITAFEGDKGIDHLIDMIKFYNNLNNKIKQKGGG